MIILPTTDAQGKPRVSYSQVSSWNKKDSFNSPSINDKITKVSGKEGYILDKFLKYQFPQTAMDAFAPFGQKVEDAICTQDFKGFYANEIETLKKITPIGVFQKEFTIDFGDFVLLGFKDDCDEEEKHLRDYKTASASSVLQYQENDYYQLDIYALDTLKSKGYIPDLLEVVAIERLGNPFRNEELTVGDTIWVIERETSLQRLQEVEEYIRRTVNEISETYKLFLELTK
jgi:hypothetical protein